MPYVQSEVETKITQLETALARGELRVDFADRSVTYKNTKEIVDAIAHFQRVLARLAAQAGTGRGRQTFATAASGF